MIIGIIICLIMVFIIGILFARKNKNKVNKAIEISNIISEGTKSIIKKVKES